MSGISSQALNFGSPENKKKYNGIEKENDLELEIYDAQLRELDGQVGRWWEVDPKTENMEMWSPYASNYDNPMRYSDPLGDEGKECCRGVVPKWLTDIATDGAQRLNARLNQVGEWFSDTWDQMQENKERRIEARATIFQQVADNPMHFVSPAGPLGIVKGAFQTEAKVLVSEVSTVVKGEVNAVAKVESKALSGTAVKNSSKGTDFVVTEKGTAIPVPDNANGPSPPNKGSGMSYQGGSGGKGMSKKVTGVRIMDANKNQGRRVNYMNKEGQTVNPKTGRTIKLNDPNGHIPFQ